MGETESVPQPWVHLLSPHNLSGKNWAQASVIAVYDGIRKHIVRSGRNFKNVAPQKQMQFVKSEHNMQNAIALLNYLKRIAPQQFMLRMQVFTKNLLSVKNASAKIVTYHMLYKIRRIWTWISRLLSAGLNHHAIRPT